MPLRDQGARVDRNDATEKGNSCSADGPKGYRESLGSDGSKGRRSCGESLGADGPRSHRIDNAGIETSPCAP